MRLLAVVLAAAALAAAVACTPRAAVVSQRIDHGGETYVVVTYRTLGTGIPHTEAGEDRDESREVYRMTGNGGYRHIGTWNNSRDPGNVIAGRAGFGVFDEQDRAIVGTVAQIAAQSPDAYISGPDGNVGDIDAAVRIVTGRAPVRAETPGRLHYLPDLFADTTEATTTPATGTPLSADAFEAILRGAVLPEDDGSGEDGSDAAMTPGDDTGPLIPETVTTSERVEYDGETYVVVTESTLDRRRSAVIGGLQSRDTRTVYQLVPSLGYIHLGTVRQDAIATTPDEIGVYQAGHRPAVIAVVEAADRSSTDAIRDPAGNAIGDIDEAVRIVTGARQEFGRTSAPLIWTSEATPAGGTPAPGTEGSAAPPIEDRGGIDDSQGD